MNKYIKPATVVVEMAYESALLDLSTTGLANEVSTQKPSYGGENPSNGGHSVGAAFTSATLWEDDDIE